jgi:hypothetical protein
MNSVEEEQSFKGLFLPIDRFSRWENDITAENCVKCCVWVRRFFPWVH